MEKEIVSLDKDLDNECEDDSSAVSMVEILEEEEKLHEDANAVLGGSDDRNCTYEMGYVNRQALYSCRTCAAESSDELAGVCLACSLECHEGHELIELYTKRNFRCDCGNSKFKDFTCKLCSSKLPCNPDNRYNHNYVGLYCTCSRPYPDPDDSTEDEMIQCVICEDWFHKRHLKRSLIVDYEHEMTCGSCMDSYKFLWYYARFYKGFQSKELLPRTTEPEIDVETEEPHSSPVDDSIAVCSSSEIAESISTSSEKNSSLNAVNQPPETSRSMETCRLNEISNKDASELEGAAFWPENWRKELCRCSKCMEMYGGAGILFLLDKDDTIDAYEETGKSKSSKTPYQQGLEALSTLDRTHQVDLIQEFNDLKSQLTEYLKKFAENKKVVRQEDVDEFFAQMTARKRQKLQSASSLSYYCK